MSSLNDLTESSRKLLDAINKSENEFEHIVFKNILNATIDSMNGKVFQEGFDYIQKEYGDELAEKLITMLSFGIIHAAYSAVASYHNEMVDVIKQFNVKISGLEGSIHGIEGAVTVLKKKVDDINKKEIISSVTGE